MTGPSERPASEATRIVVVDDHGLLAQSLSFALRADGLQVEHCVDLSGEGILARVEAAEPDVVLLDLDIGGALGTTLRLIPEMTGRGTNVVMLTGVTDRWRLAECVEAGAIGVISKSQPFDALVASVREAATTGSLLSPAQRDAYLSELRRHRATERERLRDFEELTPKEAQVLVALMDGLSADQIATRWVVSIATVRTQIRTMMLKLGVNSQLSAVALARTAGWPPEKNEGT